MNARIFKVKYFGPTTSLVLSDDFFETVERYTALSLELFQQGSMSKEQWEHARSYAAEAIARLLHDNPHVFRYTNDIKELKRKENMK